MVIKMEKKNKKINEWPSDSKGMKPVDLKKETKNTRKKQKKMNKHLKSIIKKTERQIKYWNNLLEYLFKIQKDLNIIRDESIKKPINERFEEKAHAVNDLKVLFDKYFDQLDLELAEKNKWIEADYKFGETFAEVLQYDIINAIDKESAALFKMVAKPLNKEPTAEEIESMKKDGTWVNDL